MNSPLLTTINAQRRFIHKSTDLKTFQLPSILNYTIRQLFQNNIKTSHQ